MRCRRLCERKPSGKQHVDAAIADQYREGGERREVLEMALLECIARFGLDRSAYKKIKARHIVSPCVTMSCLLPPTNGYRLPSVKGRVHDKVQAHQGAPGVKGIRDSGQVANRRPAEEERQIFRC